MPTIFSHPAIPLAVGLAFGSKKIKKPLLATGIVFSVLPDLDVLAFRFGIPYSSEFGHRGFSHSLVFAAVMAVIGALIFARFRLSFTKSFWFLFISMASHGLLDSLTTGGRGIELFWPFSQHRFFSPFQVIKVSPLGLSRFFSARGLVVLTSEFLWIWLPCCCLALLPVLFRRLRSAAQVS